LTGIVYALHERDLKRLLAWSSIENIGLIGLCLGLSCLGRFLGNPLMAGVATVAACLHILNHSLFKGLLFFGAATVASQAHSRNLEALGGLARYLPATAGFFLVGSLAICALPPLNGFASEFLMYVALLQGMNGPSAVLHIVGAAGIGFLALIGALAIIAFTRAFSVVFSGQARSELPLEHIRESRVSVAAMAIPSVFILAIGLFPLQAIAILASVAGGRDLVPPAFAAALGNLSLVGGGLLAGIAVLAGLRWLLVRRRGAGLRRFKTWDCGYQAGTPRLQYTASSYADMVVGLARPVLKVRRTQVPVQGEFPVAASLSTANSDRTEDYLIKPAIGALMGFFRLFAALQSRNIKQYLIYAISFIVIIICVVVGVPK
jgi:hydrogenase-4 component B